MVSIFFQCCILLIFQTCKNIPVNSEKKFLEEPRELLRENNIHICNESSSILCAKSQFANPFELVSEVAEDLVSNFNGHSVNEMFSGGYYGALPFDSSNYLITSSGPYAGVISQFLPYKTFWPQFSDITDFVSNDNDHLFSSNSSSFIDILSGFLHTNKFSRSDSNQNFLDVPTLQNNFSENTFKTLTSKRVSSEFLNSSEKIMKEATKAKSENIVDSFFEINSDKNLINMKASSWSYLNNSEEIYVATTETYKLIKT